MDYVSQAKSISPRRVEVLLNDGKEIVFVITDEGKFSYSAKQDGISKLALTEACRAAGAEFARQKQLRRQAIAV